MKKIVIGNWKLNLDHLQGIQLLQKINYSIEKDTEEKVDIVLAPSHTSLRSLQTVISSDNLKIKLSSQDISQYSEGAYTGEVSNLQLEKLNISPLQPTKNFNPKFHIALVWWRNLTGPYMRSF